MQLSKPAFDLNHQRKAGNHFNPCLVSLNVVIIEQAYVTYQKRPLKNLLSGRQYSFQIEVRSTKDLLISGHTHIPVVFGSNKYLKRF